MKISTSPSHQSWRSLRDHFQLPLPTEHHKHFHHFNTVLSDKVPEHPDHNVQWVNYNKKLPFKLGEEIQSNTVVCWWRPQETLRPYITLGQNFHIKIHWKPLCCFSCLFTGFVWYMSYDIYTGFTFSIEDKTSPTVKINTVKKEFFFSLEFEKESYWFCFLLLKTT